MLERVHTSCLRSILGVKLSDRHGNAHHVRSVCGIPRGEKLAMHQLYPNHLMVLER
jgi:hypothetical protein